MIKTTINIKNKGANVEKLVMGIVTQGRSVVEKAAAEVIYQQIKDQAMGVLTEEGSEYASGVTLTHWVDGSRITNKYGQTVFAEYGTGRGMEENPLGRYGKGQGERGWWVVSRDIVNLDDFVVDTITWRDFALTIQNPESKIGEVYRYGDYYLCFGRKAKHIFLTAFQKSYKAATEQAANELLRLIRSYV